MELNSIIKKETAKNFNSRAELISHPPKRMLRKMTKHGDVEKDDCFKQWFPPR